MTLFLETKSRSHWVVSTKSSSAIFRSCGGFTLLEVMIACFVFFVVSFSVLQVTTTGIVAAKSLQKSTLDPGIIAAEVSITNSLTEGDYSGNFPPPYEDASWQYHVEQVESNGLFRVDFTVFTKAGNAESETKMSTLMFKPGSPQGRGFGGMQQ